MFPWLGNHRTVVSMCGSSPIVAFQSHRIPSKAPSLASVPSIFLLSESASLPFSAATEAATYSVDAEGETVQLSVVSMGNPHAVLEVDDIEVAPVQRLGPILERHERFPNRANIGFMQVVYPEAINLRVFERGVGETSACGTGACAAVAVGRRAGQLAEEVAVSLPGGILKVRWAGAGSPVWLIGEAITDYEGVVDL